MGRGDHNDRALLLGRYAVFDEIASGGMASVHIGRLQGPSGFSRTVAVKRLHAHLARDPHFSARFRDEARLAAKIHHPNVVSIIDVVEEGDEVALIMDFVLGESLAKLLNTLGARGRLVPQPIASGILVPVLQGLHAAHETRGEDGAPLGLVHRDVSPQNIVVGADGVCRVLDFGIAKAATGALEQTQEGILKGKVGYLAPEQILGHGVDRRADVFAAGVVLWEMLTGMRLFKADTPEAAMRRILEAEVPPPSRTAQNVSPALDAVTLQALAKEPDLRFETAADMAVELERCSPPASSSQIASWLESVAGDDVTVLRHRVSAVESSPTVTPAADAATSPDLPTRALAGPTESGSTERPKRRGPLTAIVLFTGMVAVLALIGYVRTRPTEVSPASSVSSPAGAASRPAATASASSPVPACVAGTLTQVTSVVSGPAANTTCALREDNSVWCWGDNRSGQVGNESKVEAVAAVRVGKLEPAVEVAVGNRHVCAVLGDNHVACWGKDLVLRPTRVVGVDDVLHVRCGGRHACAARNDATVLCWGENDSGQLGATTTDAAFASSVEGLMPSRRIAVGTDHACAIGEQDGSVWCWGSNRFGQLGLGTSDRDEHPRAARVPDVPPSESVEAGDKTTFARTVDGKLYGWGFGIKRAVRVPLDRVKAIGAGGKQNCALDEDGIVWCWGFNDFGQLGASAAGDSPIPVRIANVSGATAVAAGENHVCALLSGGEIACWGANEFGQLGMGAKDRERHPDPRRVVFTCP